MRDGHARGFEKMPALRIQEIEMDLGKRIAIRKKLKIKKETEK